MIKKPTQDLLVEHGAIVLMLKIMTQVATELKKGTRVRKADLEKMVEFVVNFSDKCHHGKEEGILFPVLLKKAIAKKLVIELLGEHKTGRDYIRGIKNSLNNYKPGNPDAIHIAVNLEGYVQLLKEHIGKENADLFPEADKKLSVKLQINIENKFEKLEREVIGEGKHEEYHGWLKDLKKAYLG